MITRQDSRPIGRFAPLERVPLHRSSPYSLPGALHGEWNRLEKPVDVLFARGPSEGESKRRARFGGRKAEGEEDAARGGRARVAGRAGRDRDPVEVEGCCERLRLRAGELRRCGGGKAGPASRVDLRVRDAEEKAGLEPVAPAGEARRLRRKVRRREPDGRAETDDGRHVLGPAPPSPLLPAAGGEGLKPYPLAHEEGAGRLSGVLGV